MSELEISSATETEQTEIREALGIDAQGAGGYLDVGDVRIQWGRGGAGAPDGSISFPAPFADNLYAITGNVDAVSPYLFTLVFRYGTETGIGYYKRWLNGSGMGFAIGESFTWLAIGRRPV